MTHGPLLVLAPLRLEAALVRAGLPDARVACVGMGRKRASAAAAREVAAEPVAVAGFCGAVAPELRAGDVVVASELRTPDGHARPCRGTAPLVTALRRRGLRVHTGPIMSVERILGPGARARLRGSGAMAVDMESAWLADAAGARPLAVLRVVVDAPGRRLLDPRTLAAGVRAVWSLRRAAPALDEWARATGARRVLLAGPRSFCAGVERAIEIVEQVLAQRGAPVYVRKQIVHNVHVVSDLERRGAIFVEELDEVPPGSTVVFSAHGVSPQVRAEARERRLEVVDATCPLVSKVHAEARRFAAEGRTIFLVGHDGHEEVEGTSGEAPEAIRLVETAEDVDSLDAADPSRVAYLTQTTLAVDEAEEVVAALRKRFPALVGPRSDDICYATHNRQQALKAVARESDVVLVVGSDTSSNSKRLVEVSERQGTPAYLIDDERDLNAMWLAGAGTIGLTAGASAPEALVRRVIEELSGLGPVDVVDRSIKEESVQFALPKELA
jgi:4-hydroxy-3-methylbut-2-enyl diphosphate reductase